MEEMNTIKKTVNINVFLDTGLQKIFIPLYHDGGVVLNNIIDKPDSLIEAIETINDYGSVIPSETIDKIKDCFIQNSNLGWRELYPYLRCRFGNKVWHLKNGQEVVIYGLWIMVETNTSGQDANAGIVKYDRGYFYKKDGFTEAEKLEIIDLAKGNKGKKSGDSKYIDLKERQRIKLGCFIEDEPLDFGNLEFFLSIRVPNGSVRDVDVILDLGNTRTAGLLFDHIGAGPFNINNFKQQFKILRLKPDPLSGEYDQLENVEAGIASSWIVLHALDHQSYKVDKESKEPPILQIEYNYNVQEKREGFIFKKSTYEIDGAVIKRIPQMFTQLSPVLLGDRAERVFNLPYARNLIAVGAKLQQSSPKRYYWDDTQDHVWWNMLLNEWDAHYDENPKAANNLPTLQGEMLRFIRYDGKKLDLTKELDPTLQPLPYPKEPSFPKQSTLTWMLLHILESAYAQTNTTFSQGQNFIPHRLRKVLITYPSGWTKDEVNRYRDRCQEALDIFSHTNIYHGLKSKLKLEMVPQDNTPDEAVAGQLPFVFSEVVRYPNQTLADWISIVGKKRSEDINTARVMNFDIGGGTTDISIVEYQDLNAVNARTNFNLLSTMLLFKDGQTLAGDDLVEKVIEKIILGGLIKSKKGMLTGTNSTETISDRIIKLFTTVFANPGAEAIRSRIVRTCLIPLATKCLVDLRLDDMDMVKFSAKDAGVKENNWNDFCEFLGVPPAALRYNKPEFEFQSKEINDFIEQLYSPLFKNCAMYAAAYDVDLIIFSGKPSELPYFRKMANRYIPISEERIIFARDFKPGNWYPFIDDKGNIQDAKTVTVVGGALYYALSNGFIAGWSITKQNSEESRYEWGEIGAMKSVHKRVLLHKKDDAQTTYLLPNTIIARRQNISSSPEPVYKFVKKGDNVENKQVKVTISRNFENGDSLYISAIDGSEDAVKDYELKLWPCENSTGFDFWQEVGKFPNIEN